MVITILRVCLFILACIIMYNFGHTIGYNKGVDTCTKMLMEYTNATREMIKKKVSESKGEN